MPPFVDFGFNWIFLVIDMLCTADAYLSLVAVVCTEYSNWLLTINRFLVITLLSCQYGKVNFEFDLSLWFKFCKIPKEYFRVYLRTCVQ